MNTFDDCLHSQPGVTEEEFAALEKTVILPEDLKTFYRRRNGGAFQKGRKYFFGGDAGELPLRAFHPIGRTFGERFLTIDTLLKWQRIDGALPVTLVPFCSDEGDDFYYIQADGKGEKVYYIVHEGIGQFRKAPESCQAAESFTDFLERIYAK